MKKISTIRHYKRTKNGSLRFVGIEHVEVEEHHWGHIKSLDWRDKADARRLVPMSWESVVASLPSPSPSKTST